MHFMNDSEGIFMLHLKYYCKNTGFDDTQDTWSFISNVNIKTGVNLKAVYFFLSLALFSGEWLCVTASALCET